MTQEELKNLLNELAKKITEALNIIPEKIEKAVEDAPFIKIINSTKTPNNTQIEYDRILYKLGEWDNKKPLGILMKLAQGKTITQWDRRPSEYKNNDDLYLTLSYEFEIGDTKRNSPQKQASSRRFLYHFIITQEKEFIRRNHELKENNNKGKTNPHINRWIAKKCIKLEPDKNVILSETTVNKCKKEIEEMMNLVNKGIKKYRESGEEDKEIISSIIAELLDNGNEDFSTEDSLLPIARKAYEKICGSPYTGLDSFSDLFCSLEDKDKTNENSNKTDDNWEGAREELLKEILRQITPSNMSTNQKSKTDNQKFANKMLSILFPNHKYTPETKDKGIDFLHTLLENKKYGGVNILSTVPIFDGSDYRRSYKAPYNIEGTDYYISNDWTWDGSPNLKAYKVIPEICKQDYVTETMKQQLQELAEEWSQSVPSSPKKESTTTTRNLIYFGAPGTGKSYLLNEEAKKFEKKQSGTEVTECGLTEYVERVTFHTEYTYFDFVGSYKPMMVGDNIKYAFEPGPFARVLKKALSDPGKDYLLIIEEINRARVAAVFGDMFQLLDRNSNGQSEYFITPAKDLQAYLSAEEKDAEGNIIQQRAELASGKLRLPSNMFIWATMNSADQGVFPMDTAFKRRWSFKYVGIDDSEDNIKGNCAKEWKELRKRINQLLQEAGINEDKQLGPFFLKASELEDEKTFLKAFSEKVIMYLFEDAARHHRSHIFTQDNPRYSTLTEKFNGTPDSIFNTPKQQDSNTQVSGSENT